MDFTRHEHGRSYGIGLFAIGAALVCFAAFLDVSSTWTISSRVVRIRTSNCRLKISRCYVVPATWVSRTKTIRIGDRVHK